MTNTNAKILLIDIETSPIVAYTWGPKWETNIVEFIKHPQILSYSAKWLGGDHITKGQIDYPGYRANIVNDKKIVRDLWRLLDKAEIVVAQNGKAFDVKVMNSRFLFRSLPPPSPYKVVDPRLEAKKCLNLASFKLDDLCDYFGIGRKMEHEGFPLWKGCMAGDKTSWDTMKRYNKQDVVLLEKLYLKLKPFMKGHPNMGVFHDGRVCPHCEGTRLHRRGFSYNKTTKTQRWQCLDCRNYCSDGKNVIIKKNKPLVAL